MENSVIGLLTILPWYTKGLLIIPFYSLLRNFFLLIITYRINIVEKNLRMCENPNSLPAFPKMSDVHRFSPSWRIVLGNHSKSKREHILCDALPF